MFLLVTVPMRQVQVPEAHEKEEVVLDLAEARW